MNMTHGIMVTMAQVETFNKNFLQWRKYENL